MNFLLNRAKIYTLYFSEYLRYGELRSTMNAVLYLLTGKSYSGRKKIKTRLGLFETRKGTLDFQYINYAYEIDLKRFIEKQDYDVFLDIGACLGEYCIWLAKQGHRCLAFEPVFDSFEMITKNILLNNVQDKVSAYNFGLGMQHSVEYFELNSVNPGANRRVPEPNENTQKFEICALDDIFKNFDLLPDTKILIKVDVEGMEVEMLKGATKFFQCHDNITMIIEEKISGGTNIMNALDLICKFEYGKVDDLNIYARKVAVASL